MQAFCPICRPLSTPRPALCRQLRKGGCFVQKIPLEKKRAFLINLAFFLAVFGIVYFLICYALPWMMPFLFAYFVALWPNRSWAS